MKWFREYGWISKYYFSINCANYVNLSQISKTTFHTGCPRSLHHILRPQKAMGYVKIFRKKKPGQLFWHQIFRYSFLQCEVTWKGNHNYKTELSFWRVKSCLLITIMCKFWEWFSIKLSHGDYFLTELAVLANYRSFTMLIFRKKHLVKIVSFCNIYIISYAKQNTVRIYRRSEPT